MEVVLKRYLSASHRDEQTMGCPLPAVVGEIGTTAPEHRAVLAEQIEALVRGLEEHLPAEGKSNRRLVAIGLVALMYGGLGLARARCAGHAALRRGAQGRVPGRGRREGHGAPLSAPGFEAAAFRSIGRAAQTGARPVSPSSIAAPDASRRRRIRP